MKKVSLYRWLAVAGVLLLVSIPVGLWFAGHSHQASLLVTEANGIVGRDTVSTRADRQLEPPSPMTLPADAPGTRDSGTDNPGTQAESAAALPAISPEIAAEIRRLSNHTSAGLEETVHPDGSSSVALQGHFQSVVAAAIGPDGKIVVRHGEDFLQNIKQPNP